MINYNSKFIRKLFYKNTGLILFGTFVSNNIITLRLVNNDAMSPVLSSNEPMKDVVVVLRATKYHKNDVIMYKNPVDGKETFGRLTMFNTAEDIESVGRNVPSGHCWVHNDNPRSDETDSRHFGPIPLGLIKGYVMATVFPPARAKLMVG